MFNHNDKLIELLKQDNGGQLTKGEYIELIRLLDEARERIETLRIN
jgi:hypothetical protein